MKINKAFSMSYVTNFQLSYAVITKLSNPSTVKGQIDIYILEHQGKKGVKEAKC